eukprot:TRINITY_DN9993_c2_g1_i2.p1 TRINITY_DN9993_c2_g1~~TRINITY_DN9993_c2_g1_i2.p1  ORF type:complete len:322 (-),score=59.56 TRINITY_DN9993_c2_g1_i2:229-1158(-)
MAAVYTPMKAGGFEIDVDLIPKYAKLMADRNIMHVMPAGTNGESLSLSVEERKRLAEAWAKSGPANGVKVYIHVGCESVADAMELARHASSLEGISGITAQTPTFFKPSLDTLAEFLAAVAGEAPKLPFWYYHFPGATDVIPGQAHKLLAAVEETKKIPNLVGVKFTDYNLMDFKLCLLVGHPGKYNMLYGRDEQFLSALDLGADGAVSSTAQYSPWTREVMARFTAKDEAGAQAAQVQTTKLCGLFGDYAPELNVQKAIMRMSGLDVGPSRLPKADLQKNDFEDLKDKLLKAKFIDVIGDAQNSLNYE